MNKTILIAFAAICLNGCSITNYFKLKFENDDIQAHWPNNQQTSEVIADIDEKPYIYMSINGVKGFKMFLDTGASISILYDSEKVKRLDLQQGYSMVLGGWGDGENSKGFQTDVSTIKIGDVHFNDVSFAYLPASQTSYYSRQDELVIDGVIGHDILKHFTWYIDAKSNQIKISNQPYYSQQGDTVIPMEVSRSKLYFDAQVKLDNERTFTQTIALDTGSRHYLKLNTYHLKNDDLMPAGKSVTGSDFGLTGQAIHQRTTVPSINLNGLALENVKTNLINGDDDGISVIGSALLNQYSYVLDYQQTTLFIQQPQHVHFKSRYNLIGMELRQLTSGNFVVRSIMPDMAAAKTGIKQGDEVISINGRPAKEMNQTAWLTQSNIAGEHQVCIARDQQCFNVHAKHIQGFSL